ncbi:MAG: alpha/beta hydrolase [Cyanobacteria bacterium P01_C01_bin.72]
MQNIKYRLSYLAIAISTVLLPSKTFAAERITFNIAPLGQFQIRVEDLDAFATTGSISPELNYYLRRLPPEQLAQLSKLLSTPLKLEPLAIAKFSNSTVGKITIQNFGKGIRGNSGGNSQRNGFYALRGAIIAAAFDQEGLTPLNLLEHYPLDTVHLDLRILTQYLERGKKLTRNRQVIERTWFIDYQQQVFKDNLIPESDPQVAGQYTWQKQTFSYQNPNRLEPGLFDLYQPNIEVPLPLIAISHGMASNRQTFAYLAQHFASHGFAVAVIEHDAISLAKFDRFLAGRDSFPEANNLLDHPLDISYVLNRLESESNIDLQQVGLIGQSFGGYSALALSGGELIAEETARECQMESYLNILMDLSSLAKCAFNQLGQSQVELRDKRIKAVVAINPMAKIFGSAGMSSVQTPTMLISGTHDLIMPPVAEQIEPFSWLNDNLEKYLVLVKPGTHFSFLQEGLGISPVPDTAVGLRPVYAYPALKALSTAFFQVHLAQKSEYRAYLTTDLSEQLNNNNFELSIIHSLEDTELEQFQ